MSVMSVAAAKQSVAMLEEERNFFALRPSDR
jgi:hypothetical protein